MVRRLGLGKNNHLTYASLALNPRFGIFNVGPEDLTLSSLQTNTDASANSADPDEMTCDKLSHQDLHCLPFHT